MGVEELVDDVGEDGCAAGRDAALGHQDEEASEKLAQIFGGGELERAAEEGFGEIGEVTGDWRESDDSLAEMIGTEAGLGFQAGTAAALAIGEAKDTAGAVWGGARQIG